MANIQVKLKMLPHGQELEKPSYASKHASGMDLRAAVSGTRVVAPGQIVLIPTGLVVELPVGYEAQIRPRSGLALKHGLTVLNAPGTIDADYRGEIKIILINLGQKAFHIETGMRVAQMVFQKVERAELTIKDTLTETQRGDGGFGHTGQ